MKHRHGLSALGPHLRRLELAGARGQLNLGAIGHRVAVALRGGDRDFDGLVGDDWPGRRQRQLRIARRQNGPSVR